MKAGYSYQVPRCEYRSKAAFFTGANTK